MFRFFLLISMILSSSAFAKTGKVFESGSDRKKLLFTWTQEKTVEPGTPASGETPAKPEVTKIHNIYSDADGKPVVVEDLVLEGDTIKSFKVDQLQTAKHGLLEVNGSELAFRYADKTKDLTEKKPSSEKLKGHLLVGPLISEHMQKNMEELKAGKTISIRLAVLDREETVGFDFKKKKENADGSIAIEMKASAMLIAALVKPVEFNFSSKGEPLSINGRVVPKLSVGNGKFKDLDAEFVFDQ